MAARADDPGSDLGERAGGPLGVFGDCAVLDEGLVCRGDQVVFAPAAAWLRLRIDAAPGCYRLSLGVEGANGLRAELLTEAGPIALPLTVEAGRFEVSMALDEAVEWLRLMPVEDGAVRFTDFAFEPCAPWHAMLPDWQLGPIRLPHRAGRSGRWGAGGEGGGVSAAENPGRRPGWARGVAVEDCEAMAWRGVVAFCGAAGVSRLRFDPPLAPGSYSFSARFRTENDAPALVEPRLWALGSAPNGWPLAYFRPVRGDFYRARVRLTGETAALVFQPRQERGAVAVHDFGWQRRSLATMAGEAVMAGASMAGRALSTLLEHLLGADHRGDGRVKAMIRLLSRADRRHRAALRGVHEARLRQWLARPVAREKPIVFGAADGSLGKAAADAARAQGGRIADEETGTGGAAGAGDVLLESGCHLAPNAVAAMERAAPQAPLIFDRDKRVLGLPSAPTFAALPRDDTSGHDDIPLTLVHDKLGRARRGARDRGENASAAQGAKRPMASLIVPTKDAPQHLERFMRTVRRTNYPAFEVVFVDNGTRDGAALALLEAARQAPDTAVVRDDRPFNFASLVNLGVAHCRGEVLVLANNDIEFTEPTWLDALVDALDVPKIGIAGALLHYPDGRVQHAGTVLAGEARVRHLERFAPGGDSGYLGRRRRLTIASAVTGALMAVRRETFAAVGGLRSERFQVLYNDIDFCLRVRETGGLSALVPAARAVHHESVSFGKKREAHLFARGGPLWRLERAAEADRFREDWGDLCDGDPCYPVACDPLEAEFAARV